MGNLRSKSGRAQAAGRNRGLQQRWLDQVDRAASAHRRLTDRSGDLLDPDRRRSRLLSWLLAALMALVVISLILSDPRNAAQ